MRDGQVSIENATVWKYKTTQSYLKRNLVLLTIHPATSDYQLASALHFQYYICAHHSAYFADRKTLLSSPLQSTLLSISIQNILQSVCVMNNDFSP